jgi:hypothetical protein
VLKGRFFCAKVTAPSGLLLLSESETAIDCAVEPVVAVILVELPANEDSNVELSSVSNIPEIGVMLLIVPLAAEIKNLRLRGLMAFKILCCVKGLLVEILGKKCVGTRACGVIATVGVAAVAVEIEIDVGMVGIPLAEIGMTDTAGVDPEAGVAYCRAFCRVVPLSDLRVYMMAYEFVLPAVGVTVELVMLFDGGNICIIKSALLFKKLLVGKGMLLMGLVVEFALYKFMMNGGSDTVAPSVEGQLHVAAVPPTVVPGVPVARTEPSICKANAFCISA